MTARFSIIDDPVNPPFEKRYFACSARQIENLFQKRFSRQMNPSQEFTKKNFRRHKTVVWRQASEDWFLTLDYREAFKYSLNHHDVMVVNKTDEEWKNQLNPQQYKVLRKKATEPAFTGKYLHNKEKGIYVCAACGAELFSSDTKYDSGSGWPSFWTALAKDNIVEIPDRTLGMDRIEIQCKNCGGHLGHVFDDGPQPTGMRYCVNSLSLDFKKRDSK